MGRRRAAGWVGATDAGATAMTTTVSDHARAKCRAAGDLAWALRAARIHLATTRPRICSQCGHCFTVPSLTSGKVCAGCAVRFDRQAVAPSCEDAPDDAPGDDCPDHGPNEGDCPKCD